MSTDRTEFPRFEVRPLSREEGGGYLVEFPDYPGCMADGETPEEAVREARDALTSYLATLEELERLGPGNALLPNRDAMVRVRKTNPKSTAIVEGDRRKASGKSSKSRAP